MRAAVLLFIAGAHAGLVAQEFAVVSVRPNTSGEQFINFRTQAGRFSATNTTVHDLIRIAYAVQPFQLADEPAWFRSERYDIVAKADGTPSRDDLRVMLRALLADRFALRARIEARDAPIYELVVASGDGTPRPTLRRVTIDCDPRAIDARRAARDGGAASPPPPPDRGARPECGMAWGGGFMSAGGVSMAQLAEGLAGRVGRAVADRTALGGYFEFELEFAPDAAAAPGDLPSLFAALQEQLGLRLRPARGPTTMILVESAARPSAN